MVHRVAFLNYEKTAISHFYTFSINYTGICPAMPPCNGRNGGGGGRRGSGAVETDFSTMGLILITTCYIFTQNQ